MQRANKRENKKRYKFNYRKKIQNIEHIPPSSLGMFAIA
jgi:hypothetical protein